MGFTLVRLVLSDITESATPISNVKSVTTCLLMHITIPLLGLMKHVLLSVTLIMLYQVLYNVSVRFKNSSTKSEIL